MNQRRRRRLGFVPIEHEFEEDLRPARQTDDQTESNTPFQPVSNSWGKSELQRHRYWHCRPEALGPAGNHGGTSTLGGERRPHPEWPHLQG